MMVKILSGIIYVFVHILMENKMSNSTTYHNVGFGSSDIKILQFTYMFLKSYVASKMMTICIGAILKSHNKRSVCVSISFGVSKTHAPNKKIKKAQSYIMISCWMRHFILYKNMNKQCMILFKKYRRPWNLVKKVILKTNFTIIKLVAWNSTTLFCGDFLYD